MCACLIACGTSFSLEWTDSLCALAAQSSASTAPDRRIRSVCPVATVTSPPTVLRYAWNPVPTTTTIPTARVCVAMTTVTDVRARLAGTVPSVMVPRWRWRGEGCNVSPHAPWGRNLTEKRRCVNSRGEREEEEGEEEEEKEEGEEEEEEGEKGEEEKGEKRRCLFVLQ